MESSGALAPWMFLGLFIAASFLMIWRLEALTERGVEGTVLGTLVMPYCSGMGNLIFALVLGGKGGPETEVLKYLVVTKFVIMCLILGVSDVLCEVQVLI